jgi:hypothetical protein
VASLLTAQDGTISVMVAGSDGKAHQQTVKAGFRDGDKVQIIAGLQAGDKIVGTGAYGLPDNSPITAAEAKPEEKNQPQGSSQKE